MKRIQQALELSRREPVVVAALQTELPAAAVEPPQPHIEQPAPLVELTPPVKPLTNVAGGIRRRGVLHALSQATLNRNRLKLGTESDATAEAYRVVRARVLQWLDANGRNSIAMVSAAPDEGKTLTAVNLAL